MDYDETSPKDVISWNPLVKGLYVTLRAENDKLLKCGGFLGWNLYNNLLFLYDNDHIEILLIKLTCIGTLWS
jgi:hypothetical protein